VWSSFCEKVVSMVAVILDFRSMPKMTEFTIVYKTFIFLSFQCIN
jgi:hypothetical protein